MLSLDSPKVRNLKRLCLGLMREVKVKARLDQTLARPDLGNAGADVQSIPSLMVHVGSDHEHMDLDVADVSPQPYTEQLDERFTATAYPKQFKATATKTTTTTTTKLPPPPAQQQSTVEAMIMKRIGELKHVMANLIQENKGLEERLDSHGSRLYTLEQLDIPHQVSKAVSEVVTKAIDWAMQAPLRNRFRDLPKADMKEILHQRMWETESYKSHEDHMRLYEALEKSMNRDHSQELAQDLAEACKKNKKSRESPKTSYGSPPHHPPPPPPPPGPSRASGALGASGSSQVPPPPPPPSSTNQEKERSATPEPTWLIPSSDVPVPMNKWASAQESNYSPPPEDSLLAQTGDIAIFMDWFCKRRGITELKPQDLGGPAFEIVKIFHPDQTITTRWSTRSSHNPIRLLFNKYLEYLRYGSKGSRPALSILKMKTAYYPNAGLERLVPDQFWIKEDTVRTHMRILSVVRIEVFSMYGYDYMKKIVLRHADLNEHVIAERDFKFKYEVLDQEGRRLEQGVHVRHSEAIEDKEDLPQPRELCWWTRYRGRLQTSETPALSILKMKTTYYPNAGLEQLVPDQFWIKEDTVRTHMRILSVVRIKVFSMYGYDYMKKIVLRHADLNEHVIAERDFKYLYPSDFEDMYLLNLQGHLNHLPPKDKKILTTAINQ
nr:hypothetical protein [Tanacetum cinerariifolium]